MAKPEISEYEQKRLEKIAQNQALMRDLAQNAAASGFAPSASRKPRAAPKPKKPATPKIKEPAGPVRTSSRLRGIVADSEVAKRKAEEQDEAQRAQEQAKRQRRSSDLNLSDVHVAGKEWDSTGNFLSKVGPAKPYVRTFDADASRKAADKEVKALRKQMSGLELWDGTTPSNIKITPERIYSLGFHPTTDKPLVFAGDKLGSVGIFDASQTPSNDEKDEDEEDEWEPNMSTFKTHTRTIHSLQFSPSDSNVLYTASYDSSIRKLDLASSLSVEVYAPKDGEDEPLSGVELTERDPNMLHFTTLGGRFGMHDMRSRSPKNGGDIGPFQLSDKKIGGFSLHPSQPHLLATASLDRTLKIWDLRRITGPPLERMPLLVGEHTSRLSISHAAFNLAGQVATSSYDDTVKIYNFGNCASWQVGTELEEESMKPSTIIPHNNQTGRWVTILRPQWQASPSDGIQRFVIGNMNRFVDIYASTGEQLAQLGGEDITAVPAVAQFHPTMNWVAGGTASGKLCLWM
ncbi:WD40 repeat-like protein [Aulographum hederae CBS 113979]|uniref:DNA damage-binding protein CMR1 n=1 Tax=Aulographum hederae CBS 113979 TaxID=1176131 RepID=A0A6G1GUE7_9PEZI|nr:WD40 repeat-like protein [Aulographum hederae CBS 113979]